MTAAGAVCRPAPFEGQRLAALSRDCALRHNRADERAAVSPDSAPSCVLAAFALAALGYGFSHALPG